MRLRWLHYHWLDPSGEVQHAQSIPTGLPEDTDALYVNRVDGCIVISTLWRRGAGLEPWLRDTLPVKVDALLDEQGENDQVMVSYHEFAAVMSVAELFHLFAAMIRCGYAHRGGSDLDKWLTARTRRTSSNPWADGAGFEPAGYPLHEWGDDAEESPFDT